MDDILISFDVDWAPDFIIDAVANILIQKNVKATWFITHNSDGIQRLFEHQDIFEIGVHPNFMPGSTQGKSAQEIMTYLMRLAPNAKSVRTHGMFYSAEISRMFSIDFGLKIDSSIFLSGMPNILPHKVFYNGNCFLRMPYFWSDDGEMSIMQSPSFDFNNEKYHKPGMKILDFHPIHIFLNSEKMVNYNLLKSKINIKDCNFEHVENFINNSNGSGSFLKQIIRSNPNNFKTISELADNWMLC